ncbi:MAG: alpha-glucosidase C-terminal domain-containing protein [Candidatus Aminicenantes bacterium]|nr:alpha-glucosidase C-terminal domain-containing protein [Candidatus Aminicenantes bacterium]
MASSTVPGVPFIHAGQETGDTKADYISGKINESVRDFYKKVFSIRSQNPALKYDGKESISNIWKSGDNIYAYLRGYEKEKVIVTINFQNKEAISYLDLSFLNKGTVLYDELNNEELSVNEPSNFKISVPAYGSRILTIKR